jgi:hypothetical protein
MLGRASRTSRCSLNGAILLRLARYYGLLLLNFDDAAKNAHHRYVVDSPFFSLLWSAQDALSVFEFALHAYSETVAPVRSVHPLLFEN